MNAFRFRLPCAALAATLHGLAFAAEFPTVVNGVLTLDTRESVTYDQPLPGDVSQLVKTGVGEAVLTAATTAFTGAVDVQAGTLTLKDAGAVGTGTKIEVTGDAATLHLNFANPRGWDTVFFAGHNVAIQGQGVDGKGAFRYTDPGSGQNDNMLESLTLTGDASIAIPSRFGICSALNLNGHTLTRVDGGANWMMRSGKTLTVGAGTICNKTGVIAWQNDPVFEDPANTVLRMEGGTLEAHGAKQWNCKVVFAGGAFKGKWSGENGLAQPVTISAGTTVSQDAASSVTRMAGAVAATADVVLAGKGLHYFDGPFASTGSVWFQGGVTFIGADFTVGNMLRLCGSGKLSAPCAVWQTAGNFRADTPDGWIVRLGQVDNSCSAYVMTGGTAAFAGLLNVGSGTGARGFLLLENGAISATNGVVTSLNDTGGVKSDVWIGVNGGTFKATANYEYDRTKTTRLAAGDGATGVLVVTGEGATYETSELILGPASGAATTRVVVTEGGVLKVGRLYCENDAAATASGIYVNGGVVKPTFWASWAENYLRRADKTNPQSWTVGESGLIVDLSDLKAESETVEVTANSKLTIDSNLSDATGRGLATIELPDNNEDYDKEVYVGPAFVEIEGPSGSHGAVAMATCDPTAHKLTKIAVAAPGSGYDETTKVYVRSADGTSRYECTRTLTEARRAGGKLVKRGAPTLALGGVNTYTGGTVVEAGTLTVSGDQSFPTDTPLTVLPGATFDAAGKALTVSVLSGSGGTVNCDTLTVTEELEITVADLFSEDARPLTVNAALSFGENVAVKIVDPENLATYVQNRSRIVLRATDGLAGAVPVLSGEVGEKWFLIKSGNALKFGSRRGICLIVR